MNNNSDDNWANILAILAFCMVVVILISMAIPFVIKNEEIGVRRFAEDAYCQMSNEVSIPCY